MVKQCFKVQLVILETFAPVLYTNFQNKNRDCSLTKYWIEVIDNFEGTPLHYPPSSFPRARRAERGGGGGRRPLKNKVKNKKNLRLL